MNLKFDADKIKDKAKAFILKQVTPRIRLVFLIIFAACLLCNFVLLAVMNSLIGQLPEQLLAQRWSRDKAMAQVSLYITQDREVQEQDIMKLQYGLEKKLAEAGVENPDDDEKEQETGKVVETISIDEMNEEWMYTPPERTGYRKLYAVAYSAQGIISVSFENRTADNVSAIGVGGDFFLFHPMEFVTGSFFTGDDLMKDRIVIDEDMAWQLFGSVDIVGESVSIGGVPHMITGVVKKEKGKLHEAAGLDKGYVYLSYDSLSKYGYILSGRTTPSEVSELGQQANLGGINCIEVVCPNPVKGLALKSVKESLGIADEYVVGVDNTNRFSVFALWSVIRSFGKRSMWSKAIFYPYWENVARGYEDILAVLLLIRLLCILTAVVIFVISIINAYRKKTWTVRSVIKYLADKKYELESEHRQKKLKKETTGA